MIEAGLYMKQGVFDNIYSHKSPMNRVFRGVDPRRLVGM